MSYIFDDEYYMNTTIRVNVNDHVCSKKNFKNSPFRSWTRLRELSGQRDLNPRSFLSRVREARESITSASAVLVPLLPPHQRVTLKVATCVITAILGTRTEGMRTLRDK